MWKPNKQLDYSKYYNKTIYLSKIGFLVPYCGHTHYSKLLYITEEKSDGNVCIIHRPLNWGAAIEKESCLHDFQGFIVNVIVDDKDEIDKTIKNICKTYLCEDIAFIISSYIDGLIEI